MEDPLRTPIPGHFDPFGLWCLQRRGIPLTPTRARCTCCEAMVILHRRIPATGLLATA